MDWADLAVAVIASGALTAVVQAALRRRNDAVAALNSVAAGLNTDLLRLRAEREYLQILVGALESEIVAMGGDPIRVRRELTERLQTEGEEP